MFDQTDNHEWVLIITKSPSKEIELVRPIQEKGYQICYMLPSADFNSLNTKHLISILLIDCPEFCVQVVNQLRNTNNRISSVPITWITKSETLKPKEALESGIESLMTERRYHERRKLINLSEQKQADDEQSAGCPAYSRESTKQITLLILSEETELISKLQSVARDYCFKMIVTGLMNDPEFITQMLKQISPDLILIDTTLVEQILDNWLKAIRRINERLNIILLSDKITPDLLNKITEFGISGLVQLNAGNDVYLKAIHAILRGEIWLPRLLIKQIFSDFYVKKSHIRNDLTDSDPSLTRREQLIVFNVTLGKTNKQIAQELGVSPETIKKHLQNIFAKFGIHNRNQLISKNTP